MSIRNPGCRWRIAASTGASTNALYSTDDATLRPAQLVLGGTDSRYRFFCERNDRAARLVRSLAGFGQVDAAGAAYDQACAQFEFEPLDTLADTGFTDTEPVSTTEIKICKCSNLSFCRSDMAGFD
jgi:hypothetical protein